MSRTQVIVGSFRRLIDGLADWLIPSRRRAMDIYHEALASQDQVMIQLAGANNQQES